MQSNAADQAMFSDALPVNPRPFAQGLVDLLAEGNSIRSDKVLRVLWILNMQAYGQLATIDMCKEYERLDATNG